jgi:hypothetical protein
MPHNRHLAPPRYSVVSGGDRPFAPMHSEPLPPAATPGYLTEALRRCGALGKGVVGAVAVDTDRETIVSRILRLRISYDGAAAAAPRSMILIRIRWRPPAIHRGGIVHLLEVRP